MDTTAWRYMTGQRVPMLVALGRSEEARRSAAVAHEARAGLPAGSDVVALIDWHSGMAAFAAGRADEAARLFAQVVQMESRAAKGTLGEWRHVMARCALGAALMRTGRAREARVHLHAACPALDGWGRADASVKAWGAAARARR